ncbi:serine protease, DegP/HtrA, do-like [Lachnospiraceae bacterium KM106-2]|nr:serine protease, DegP/HtrA, do-like [Lachnospiraceae bacterium KM106-2]
MANVNREEKSYSFVEEKILPKRKRRVKRILFTVLQAIIFGVVSCFVFICAYPYLSDLLGKPSEPIKLPSTTSAPEKTAVPTATPKPSESPKDRDSISISDIRETQRLYQGIANEVNPSIVTVTMVKKGVDLFNNSYENTNTTSGIILANSGENILILVDYKRVKNSNKIKVTFQNDITVEGTLFNSSKELGIAVIAVSVDKLSVSMIEEIKAAKLGESYVLEEGDPIIALGNPNGYMYSMEQGTITNQVQSAYITDHKVELFNTNIEDNSNGNGIIVNLDGEIIGLISHTFKKDLNENINTCLAISSVKPILELLLNKTQMVYFGVVANDVTSEIASIIGVDKGVYVTEVAADSPAFQAGIITGDVIQSIDDKNVASMTSFFDILSDYRKDDTIKVKVIRTTDNKKEVTLKVTLKTH